MISNPPAAYLVEDSGEEAETHEDLSSFFLSQVIYYPIDQDKSGSPVRVRVGRDYKVTSPSIWIHAGH